MGKDRLANWKSGDEGFITELTGASALTDRLLELGMVPGAWVKVVQHGSPMLIQIGDTRICMRRADATTIGARGLHAATTAAPVPTSAQPDLSALNASMVL